jgi:hypothetical protein
MLQQGSRSVNVPNVSNDVALIFAFLSQNRRSVPLVCDSVKLGSIVRKSNEDQATSDDVVIVFTTASDE